MRWRGRTSAIAYVIEQTHRDSTLAAQILAWDYEAWFPVLGSRPREAEPPGNVVTGFLAGFEPAPFAAQSPAPAPSAFPKPQQRCAVVRRRDASAADAVEPVLSESERVLTHNGPLVRFSRGLCDRRRGFRTRSLTSASWTRQPRRRSIDPAKPFALDHLKRSSD